MTIKKKIPKQVRNDKQLQNNNNQTEVKPYMKNTRKAFTLTELLIALGIIGAIAAISIPSLMSNIQNRLLAAQLKSNVSSIQQLISDQMVRYNTKDLSMTDFKSTDTMLSDSNFEITKVCESGSARTNCWKMQQQTPSNKNIQYKFLSGSNAGPAEQRVIITKNGAIIGYRPNSSSKFTYNGVSDKLIGVFDIDVNGNEGPNIVGRDFFSFYVTQKGKIVDCYYSSPNTLLTTKKAACKNSAFACFGAVVDDGWKIDY